MNFVRMMAGAAIVGMLGIAAFFVIGYIILPLLLIGTFLWGIRMLCIRFGGIGPKQEPIHILNPKHPRTTHRPQRNSDVIDVEYTEL